MAYRSDSSLPLTIQKTLLFSDFIILSLLHSRYIVSHVFHRFVQKKQINIFSNIRANMRFMQKYHNTFIISVNLPFDDQ